MRVFYAYPPHRHRHSSRLNIEAVSSKRRRLFHELVGARSPVGQHVPEQLHRVEQLQEILRGFDILEPLQRLLGPLRHRGKVTQALADVREDRRGGGGGRAGFESFSRVERSRRGGDGVLGFRGELRQRRGLTSHTSASTHGHGRGGRRSQRR